MTHSDMSSICRFRIPAGRAVRVLSLAGLLVCGSGCVTATPTPTGPAPEPQASSATSQGDFFGGAIMGDEGEVALGPGGPAPSDIARKQEPEDDTIEVSEEAPDDLASTVVGGDGVAVDLASLQSGSGMEASIRFEDLDRHLLTLAAEADDPMPYELVRAMLAMIMVNGLEGGELDAYRPQTTGLLVEETETLDAVGRFANAIQTRIGGGEEAVQPVLIEELESLLTRLRNEDGFNLGAVEMCSSIQSYGDVVVLPRRLSTGRDRELLVYAELDGLRWSPAAQSRKVGWEIEYRLELHQLADDLVIDPGVLTRQSHALDEPVEDTFFWIRYTLPAADLKAGKYALKLWVREPGTSREVEKSIPIELLPERMLIRAAASATD